MSAKARILAALKDGPKTTAELCQPSVGGVRFGARLMELRHDEGHTITEERLRAGSSRYTLVGSSSGHRADWSPAALRGPSRAAARSSELVWSFIAGERRSWIRTGCPAEGKLPHVDSLAQGALWT